MATRKQPLEKLRNLRGSKAVILGIGNILKGDDGVGPLVCQKLRSEKVSAEVLDAGTVPENYIQTIIKQAPQNLIIIDAIDFGASPGTISIFRPEQLSSLASSTHALSPRLFINVIRRQIDIEIYVIGIQPKQTKLGQSPSAEAAEALQSLTDLLSSVFTPVK